MNLCCVGLPVKQFQYHAYLGMTNILLCLNIIPLLLFFTTFSYLFSKIRTTFNVFLIAVVCGALPIGLTMLLDELPEADSKKQVYGFQVFLGFCFPPSVSFLILYNIFQLYELCHETDNCKPEEMKMNALLQESRIFFLILASVLQYIIWWICIQMMDIAEDRGNPYRLFQNDEYQVS